MRARTRAVAATAGAALVVVPLTGAAAAALVSQDLTNAGVNPDTLATAPIDEIAGIEAGDAPAAADLAAVTATVTASEDVDIDIATPEISVKEDPPPAPAPVAAAPSSTSSSSSSSTESSGASARPVAQSSAVAAAVSGSAIIAEAAKHVGAPYVSGGSSPSGFDCSGFTSYVFAQFGISLPRSSGAYYNVGTRVSSPQPGDIIVSPGHVGIYAGPNLQIDAPTHGKTLQFRGIWQNNPTYVRVTG